MPGIPSIQIKLEALHEESFGWAMCCCQHRKEDAEEILQTTYLKVLDKKAIYKEKSAFRTWLFAIIRNTAMDFYRQKENRNRRLQVIRGAFSRAKSEETEESNEEKTVLLIQKLQQLPARQREILHLVFYQDLTIAAASEIMQVGIGTARTHYERGKKRLRQLLTLCNNEKATPLKQ